MYSTTSEHYKTTAATELQVLKERRAPPRAPVATAAAPFGVAVFVGGTALALVASTGFGVAMVAPAPLGGGMANRPSRARTLGRCSAMFCASEKSDDVSM